MTEHAHDPDDQEYIDYTEGVSFSGFPLAIGRMARRGAEHIRDDAEQSHLGTACMRLATRVETFVGDIVQRLHR